MKKKSPGKKKTAAKPGKRAPAAKKKAGSPRPEAPRAPARRKRGDAGKPLPRKMSEDLLAALQRLSPPLQQVVVESPDPTMNFRFLKLADVAYITTKSDIAGRASMLVTIQGEKFYSGESLSGWTRRFKDGNPWFMRTHESYLVNLARITGIRYGTARDLWFEGSNEPVLNIVSDSYRAAFDERVGL